MHKLHRETGDVLRIGRQQPIPVEHDNGSSYRQVPIGFRPSGRFAILRGVENGFAVVRAANNGLLTVSDAYGRVIAAKPSAGGGMVTLQAEVARGPGRTLYAETGDGLGQIALAMSLVLLGVAVAAAKRPE